MILQSQALQPEVEVLAGGSKPSQQFLRNPLGIFGAVMILIFAITALLAGIIAPPKKDCAQDLNLGDDARITSPFQTAFWVVVFAAPESCYQIPQESLSATPVAPNAQYLFGTVRGYDIFYGIVWGARTAFVLALGVIGSTLLIGLLVGLIAGYFGGWLDDLLMRITEIVFVVPSFVLTVVLVTILGQGLLSVGISLVLVGWAGYARLVRGEVLRVRTLEYVESARALGGTDLNIIVRHVLPNSVTTLAVQVTLDLGAVVLQAAALSFIGLGAPIGFADWGQLVNFSQAFMIGPTDAPFAYWFVSFFPGIIILLWGLSWNFMGDALRDALDPRVS
jgi:peptide/nickel transport system permease protein